MKNFIVVALLLSGILLSWTHAVADNDAGFVPGSYAVGVQHISFKDRARKRKLAGRVWYPTDYGTKQKQLTYSNIFLGQQAKPRAELLDAPDRLPLILFSHGSGGGHGNLAWLAEMLASYGYIVAAVDHPKDAYGNQTPAGIIMKWERPLDLSFLLDQLLEHPSYGLRIDSARVGVLGHSSGGYTAVALAGGRYDFARLSSYCDSLDYTGDCSLVTAKQVAEIDASSADLSYFDERFNLFVALVPALGQGFSEQGLAPIDSPFLIVGTRDDAVASLRNNAAHYAAGIASARFEILDRGGHFGFFCQCNSLGQQNAAKVCVDAEGIDRVQLHRQIQGMTLQFLAAQWPS